MISSDITIREATPDDKCDLVVEWRIVDAKWYEIFAKANLEKAFKVLMRLDEAAQEARSVDQEWSVEWRAGIPQMSLAVSTLRGQQTSIEFGKAYGRDARSRRDLQLPLRHQGAEGALAEGGC